VLEIKETAVRLIHELFVEFVLTKQQYEDPSMRVAIALAREGHFKQTWKAGGYSLGDLLYSLPLAPCQKNRLPLSIGNARKRTNARNGSGPETSWRPS